MVRYILLIFKLLNRLFDRVFNFLNKNPLLSILILFGLILLSTFFNFYLDPNGRVWGDSFYYLSIAKKISEGTSFDEGISKVSNEVNTLWPLGYPFLIGFVSQIFSLKVFWASKVLNLLMVLIILSLLHYYFYPYGWIYGSFLLSASFLDIFSLTLSETCFLAGLLVFVILFYKISESPNRLVTFVLLGATLAYLFLVRYIGGFALITFLAFVLWNWNHFKNKWKGVLLSCIFAAIIIAFYMGLNLIIDTHLFGPRKIGIRNPIKVIEGFSLRSLMLLNFPINFSFFKFKWIIVIFFLEGIVAINFIKRSKWIPVNKFLFKNITKYFFVSGLSYFLIFILIVFVMPEGPKPFKSRLLIPGFFVLFLALINFIQSCKPYLFKGFAKFAIVVFAGSFFLNCPLKIFYKYYVLDRKVVTYSENINRLKNKYSALPEEKAMIIEGNHHLGYLLENTERCDPNFIIKDGAEKKLDLASINELMGNYQSVYLELSQQDSELYRKLKSSNYRLAPVYNQEKFEIIRLEKV